MEITKSVVRTFTVGLSAKVPVVQYGSIEPSLFISADILEGESPEEALKELMDFARLQIALSILPIALARLNSTELKNMMTVVKDWEATKVLRLLMPHIDISEHVTMGDITVEKATAIINGWGSGSYVNGSKS